MEPAPAPVPGDERPPTRFVALCLHCLSEISEDAHFCRHCLRPLTWYAMTGPIERVWAFAWCYGRLIGTRRLPLPVFLGAWALILFLLAAELTVGRMILAEADLSGWGLIGVFARFIIGMEALFCVYTLYRITRNRFARRDGDDDVD